MTLAGLVAFRPRFLRRGLVRLDVDGLFVFVASNTLVDGVGPPSSFVTVGVVTVSGSLLLLVVVGAFPATPLRPLRRRLTFPRLPPFAAAVTWGVAAVSC